MWRINFSFGWFDGKAAMISGLSYKVPAGIAQTRQQLSHGFSTATKASPTGFISNAAPVLAG